MDERLAVVFDGEVVYERGMKEEELLVWLEEMKYVWLEEKFYADAGGMKYVARKKEEMLFVNTEEERETGEVEGVDEEIASRAQRIHEETRQEMGVCRSIASAAMLEELEKGREDVARKKEEMCALSEEEFLAWLCDGSGMNGDERAYELGSGVYGMTTRSDPAKLDAAVLKIKRATRAKILATIKDVRARRSSRGRSPAPHRRDKCKFTKCQFCQMAKAKMVMVKETKR